MRYQIEVAEADRSVAPTELAQRQIKETFFGPPDPANIRQEIEINDKVVETLRALPDLDDGVHLEREAAVETIRAVGKLVNKSQLEIIVPGAPGGVVAFYKFDRWTAGLVRNIMQDCAEEIQVTRVYSQRDA